MSDCNLRTFTFGATPWAEDNRNIAEGCSHNCLYCFAKAMATQFKKTDDFEWPQTRLRPNRKKLKPRETPLAKTAMFPSTHDITPDILPESLEFIEELLGVYERIIVLSKPHLECIQAICARFGGFRDRILFRFTIGSSDDATLKFWEPGAPSFAERLESLRHAHAQGFQTSVSCEPMLDVDIRPLVEKIRPFITESIYLGRMNMPKDKVSPDIEDRLLRLVEAHQGERLEAMYRDAHAIFHRLP